MQNKRKKYRALLVGIALTPQRNVLFSQWFWLGGLVALVIAIPTRSGN